MWIGTEEYREKIAKTLCDLNKRKSIRDTGK